MWRLILSASPPRRCCAPRVPLSVNTTIGTDDVVLERAANLSPMNYGLLLEVGRTLDYCCSLVCYTILGTTRDHFSCKSTKPNQSNIGGFFWY